ncbi:hypothetical protein [Halorubrum lacusprofundi]|jgi:hypothetical protein|uniref:Uncharacterized protein n=1 Tax=Halorubrum lacusprofundi (strain ATCC 49239 / DSM 5036 / JCM 8891 / ACAM 34) TaxID=416348 RepID=B9LX49_HALLT|nr:hypothetical protein [Halorubrum lacusprofundi]ACM59040.1 conserved hypothetical protein [Halorubrum lacusprofundi ATCC 49239]MCG1008165.1 hypothetical protein [Halorubrum lacusprofundi]
MRSDPPKTGWELVAQRDEAAALFRAAVTLDAGAEYTRSEIADAADIPLKTLYLADAMDEFVDIGLLNRVDSDEEDSEAYFSVNPDSDVLAAARDFDTAVANTYERTPQT